MTTKGSPYTAAITGGEFLFTETNGSPSSTIETDNGRTFFLIDILCHPYFMNEPMIFKDQPHEALKDLLADAYNVIKTHPYETRKQLAGTIRNLRHLIDDLKRTWILKTKR